MIRPACAVALLLLISSTPAASQKPAAVKPLRPIAPLDLAQLLDLYAEGRFDDAVQRVAAAGDGIGRRLRRYWLVSGRQWIDADPAQRPRRILVAAALALETEQIRAERGDWRMGSDDPCFSSCVLDWAQLLLTERGDPDRAERAWYLAAAALASGVRDWRYLQRTVDPARLERLPPGLPPGLIPPQLVPGLMDRALVRFPEDPALRLEQALAAASRFSVTVDGGRPVPGIVPAAAVAERPGLPATLRSGHDVAGEMLAALVDDPVVGPEARVRLGYLHWTAGRDTEAREQLTRAVEQARDTELRYLAQFLLGWIAMTRGDSAAAVPPLEAALAIRPASQSATVALAALELQRGNADRAHELARSSLDQRRADVDPWRLFLYGHHPRWAALVTDLRREVKP